MRKYHINNIDCASCAAKLERNLNKLEEVRFVNINYAGSTMTVDTNDPEKVKNKIKELEPEAEISRYSQKERIVSINELAENKGNIIQVLSAAFLLGAGILFKDELKGMLYNIPEYVIFITAYLVAGWKVISRAIRNIFRGRIFDENFLMTIATLGAFAINEMAEAITVMLFYVVGELFQDIAVSRSRRSIRSLLQIKPGFANLRSGKKVIRVSPGDVQIGDTVIVRPGEKVPLDGTVTKGESFLDSAALTGESVPRKVRPGGDVLAGMINQSGLLNIMVKKKFGDSSISRILELTEHATSQKAETEKFITSFARYYTPFVVSGAVLLAVIPSLLIPGAQFSDWLYRALVVLVISCPCALVLSIPLGYFGGVGLASRKGILVKGSDFLDSLTRVKAMVFDKTGTLTKGIFSVEGIYPANGFQKEKILEYAAYAEANSTHPVARSIMEYFDKTIKNSRIKKADELPGKGIKAVIDNRTVLAGNTKLLNSKDIGLQTNPGKGTFVHIAIDQVYAGYIVISDQMKEDAAYVISQLKEKNIKTVMLTGDTITSAKFFANELEMDDYYAELLPEDKLSHIEKLILENKEGKVVFVGDGINDAPVIARSDIGIAMGALGSDAAIEIADVVLMTDSPAKVIEAMDIAKKTRNIVWQNIVFALGVKFIFIILGIIGIANMWEAVFADMGVALLAVFNAVRILKAK